MSKLVINLCLVFLLFLSSCTEHELNDQQDIEEADASPEFVETQVNSAAESIVLDAGNLQQHIDIMGGDMERSANFLLKASNPDEILSWYFKDMHMPYFRVVYDKKQELVEGSPNMAFYDDQIIVMKKIKALNPSVKFWATLKTDYDGYGSNNNMPDWIYTGAGYNGGNYNPNAFKAVKYARFLADYLQLMHNNGVAIDFLSVSKEWQSVMTPKNERNAARQLKKILGTTAYQGVVMPEIMGPAGWGVKGTTSFVNGVAAGGYSAYFNSFCGHYYDNPSLSDWQALVNAARNIGKDVYNDESNAAGGGPYFGEEPDMENVVKIYGDKCDSYRAGIKGELLFELWSRGINKETRCVYFQNGAAGERLRGYYLTKEFMKIYDTHYLNTTLSNGIDDVKTMAFTDGKSIILYVINTSATTRYSNVSLNLLGKIITSSSIARRAWYPGSNKAGWAVTVTKQSGTSFKVNIGPNAMAIYTFDVE